MFERFTDRARRVLELAKDESRRAGHNFVGTEHLLLGLLREGAGVGGRVLQAEGLSLEEVRAAVRDVIGPGPGVVAGDAEALATIGIDLGSIKAAVEESFGPGALERAMSKDKCGRVVGAPPFTPRAKKVLELSLREALALKHNYLGTEHLLLGLLREGEGVACLVLAELAGPLPELRARVLSEMTRLRPGA